MRVDCGICANYDHAGDEYTEICEDCSEYYMEDKNCRCHQNPPCSYCVDLRFEERGEINGLYDNSLQEKVV